MAWPDARFDCIFPTKLWVKILTKIFQESSVLIIKITELLKNSKFNKKTVKTCKKIIEQIFTCNMIRKMFLMNFYNFQFSLSFPLSSPQICYCNTELCWCFLLNLLCKRSESNTRRVKRGCKYSAHIEFRVEKFNNPFNRKDENFCLVAKSTESGSYFHS